MRGPGRLLGSNGFEMDPLEMSWRECAWWFGSTIFGTGARAALVEGGGCAEGRGWGLVHRCRVHNDLTAVLLLPPTRGVSPDNSVHLSEP